MKCKCCNGSGFIYTGAYSGDVSCLYCGGTGKTNILKYFNWEFASKCSYKFHSFIYNKSYKFWDNYECPAYEFRQNLYDIDESCVIYNCLECPQGWKCYLPNSVKKIIIHKVSRGV